MNKKAEERWWNGVFTMILVMDAQLDVNTFDSVIREFGIEDIKTAISEGIIDENDIEKLEENMPDITWRPITNKDGN